MRHIKHNIWIVVGKYAWEDIRIDVWKPNAFSCLKSRMEFDLKDPGCFKQIAEYAQNVAETI